MKKPLKILYVATYIPFPIPCGGTTHILEVAKNLKKMGHEIVVVTKKIDNKKIRYRDNINFYSASWRLADVPFGKQYTIFFHAQQLVKLSIKYNIDIILERESSKGSGAIASKILNLPLVEEVNDPNCNKFSLTVAKKIYCSSKKIIPIEFRHKVHEVSWAANTEMIKPNDNLKNKKKLFGIDVPVIGYIGSYYPWHGLEELVEAIPLIIKKNNAKFVLVGDVKFGSNSLYKKEIEELVMKKKIKDYVIFINRIPYEKIPKYLSAFDICLAPYNKNKNLELAKFGFFYSPLKLFEYFAAGKPVIATNLGNIKKIVTNERGLLIPPCNPNAIAKAVNDLLNNPAKRKEMGKNARKFAEVHSWFKHCQMIEKILEESFT